MLEEHNWSKEVISSIGLAMLYPVHGQDVAIFSCNLVGLCWVAMTPDDVNLNIDFHVARIRATL